MCRLLAVIIPEEHQDSTHKEIIAPALDALASTALRLLADDGIKGNYDGTGVAQLQNGQRNILKSSYPAQRATTQDDYREFMRDVNWNYPFIGHVRAASVGKVTKGKLALLPHEHAQPFMGEHCVLMHNGTVKNWREVALSNEIDDYKTWTDTWLITQLLDQETWTYELWQTVAAQLEGSFALIGMHKQNEQELWITRIKRPLYLYELDGGKIIIVCTSLALSTALMEVGETVFKLTGYDPWNSWEYIKLDEGQLYVMSTKSTMTALGAIEAKKVVEITGINRWMPYEQQDTTFNAFKITDVFVELFKEYSFEAKELREIWELQEGVTKGAGWTLEDAKRVKRFIRWCIADEENIQILAHEVGRPIYKEIRSESSTYHKQ